MMSLTSILFPGARSRKVAVGTLSDEALALAARGRDRAGKEAFVEIVRRHQTAVCAVAYGVAGRVALMDDIAQETFLKAWRQMPGLREPGKLKAWLAKIAHGCAVDALQRERRHEPLEVEEAQQSPCAGAVPDAAAVDAEEARIIWEVLAELPEVSRVPLVLFYREGQSIAAVAEALALSADAVKQRLHRGREALRAQLAARLAVKAESQLAGVLGRVAPSALLIATIATAIGLLAAPAALAAGAFTGATSAAGAATGGSAATASTFSTAMTASSYLIASLTLAAFIPLGWKAREPEPPAVSAPAAEKPKPPADPFAAYPDSALLQEWRRLHEEHGSDAAAMPVLYASIADIKDDFRRRALRAALLAEWAGVDPAAAFAFLTGKDQGDQALQMMREWLRLDAPAAAAHIVASAAAHPDMARSLLEELVEAAPDQLGAVVARLPATNEGYSKHVEDAFAALARKDPGAARAAAEALAAGPNRARALAGAAHGWAQKDGAAALAWSKALPEGSARDAALRGAVTGWAKGDPAGALDHIADAPPGEDQGFFASDTAAVVLRTASDKDLTATLAWLQANGGKIGPQSWLGISNALGKRLADDAAGTCTFLASQPESMRVGLERAFGQVLLNEGFAQKDAVWAWVKANPGPLAEEVQQQLMGSAAWNEPQQAMRWLADLPDDAATAGPMMDRLRQLLTEPRDMASLDALLADAPEKYRGRLLALAMGAEGNAQTDYRPWLARIPQLPEADRARAVQSLAGSMAAADPQEAISWVATLGGEQQIGAVKGLVSRWAGNEPEAASIWVRDQPAGPARDAAAEALTQAIAFTDPDSAWVWAGSIGDAQTKQNAFANAALAIHQRDPARAQQMLQSGQADPAARAALENVLGLLKTTPAPSSGPAPVKTR